MLESGSEANELELNHNLNCSLLVAGPGARRIADLKHLLCVWQKDWTKAVRKKAVRAVVIASVCARAMALLATCTSCNISISRRNEVFW